MAFKDLYNEYLNLSPAERVSRAQAGAAMLLQDLKNGGLDEDQSFNILVGVLKVFVSADRLAGGDEHGLFNAVFGTSLTYDQFYDLTNGGANPELIAAVDNFIDGMTDDGKAAACLLGLCFLTADGKLTADEQRVFERIIG